MANSESRKPRVVAIADYHAPYASPIVVQAGDRVLIDRSRTTDYRGCV